MVKIDGFPAAPNRSTYSLSLFQLCWPRRCNSSRSLDESTIRLIENATIDRSFDDGPTTSLSVQLWRNIYQHDIVRSSSNSNSRQLFCFIERELTAAADRLRSANRLADGAMMASARLHP